MEVKSTILLFRLLELKQTFTFINGIIIIMNFIVNCKSKIARILSTIDQYFLEIQNSTLSMIVGLWLIFYPFDFNAYPGSLRYLDIFNPNVLGSIYLLAGVLHLLCLMSKYGFRRIRRQIMLFKSGLWAFLAILTLIANPYALLGYFCLVFMIMTFTAFLRVQIIPESELFTSFIPNK